MEHHKPSVAVLSIIGIALITGSVVMVRQSNIKIAVNKPYSSAASPIDLRYDLNNDGQVNNKDVQKIADSYGAIVPKTQTSLNRLDLKPDGVIDYKDVDAIRTYVGDVLHNDLAYFDLNIDGKVDNNDAKLFLTKFNSLITWYKPMLDIQKWTLGPGNGYIVRGSDGQVVREDFWFLRDRMPVGRSLDLNLDGAVNNKDVQLVAKAINTSNAYLQTYNYSVLPREFVTKRDVRFIGLYAFDVDKDGKITKSDATKLNDLILGGGKCSVDRPLASCDVNGDRRVDVGDVSTITSFIASYGEIIDPNWYAQTDPRMEP